MITSNSQKQICSQTNTKSHCIVKCYDALYSQQHPTRLGEQSHPQTVGLLVFNTLKI